jgi:hypothetical protein
VKVEGEFLLQFLPSLVRRFPAHLRPKGVPWVIHAENFPAYLPELGIPLLVRTVSTQVGRELDGLRDDAGAGVPLRAMLYNVDLKRRTAVTRGMFSKVQATDFPGELYSKSLFLDFLLHPSTMFQDGKVVSHRWLQLSGRGEFEFRCHYFLNLFLVFLHHRDSDSGKRERIWLGSPSHLVRVPAKFVQPRMDGRIWVGDVEISFEEESPLLSDLRTDRSTGHYLCLAEGICDYWTDYPRATGHHRHLNLVTGLFPFLYSPYDLLPLLFPFTKSPERKPLLEISLPEESFRAIVEKLERFGGVQSALGSDLCEMLLQGLARMRCECGCRTLRLVNPALVAYLVKRLGRPFVSEILSSGGLLESVERSDPLFQLAALGVGEILDLREELFRRA